MARPDVEETIAATNRRATLESLRSGTPDIVFLAARLSTDSGFEIAEEIGPDAMPATIFISTGDEFALQAFEVAAVDYLKRPLSRDRFLQAFERAVQGVKLKQVEELRSHYKPLLAALSTRNGTNGQSVDEAVTSKSSTALEHGYLKRLVVEGHQQIHIVPVENVRYLTAEDTYIRIHTPETSYLMRSRLYEMDRRLDPEQFVRIHRSTIVQLDCIESLLQRSDADYTVRLDNDEMLRVSRSRRDELFRRLETGSPRSE